MPAESNISQEEHVTYEVNVCLWGDNSLINDGADSDLKLLTNGHTPVLPDLSKSDKMTA